VAFKMSRKGRIVFQCEVVLGIGVEFGNSGFDANPGGSEICRVRESGEGCLR